MNKLTSYHPFRLARWHARTAPAGMRIGSPLSSAAALLILLFGHHAAAESAANPDAAQTETAPAEAQAREEARPPEVEDKILVTAPLNPQQEAATGYSVRRSSSATKLDLELKRTPQTVSVITEKQIKEQNLTDIHSVLNAAPGVTVMQYGVTGAGNTSYYSRGFAIRNFLLDGVLTSVAPSGGIMTRGLNGNNRFFAMDSAIYERIDVIRGSTGLVSGNGDPGATLNLVRKKPTVAPQFNAGVGYGSWNRKRAEVDFSTTLNESAGLRWRMVGVAQDGDHWMDRVGKKDYTLYNVLELPLGNDTLLRGGLVYGYQKIDGASPVMAQGVASSYITDNPPKFPGGRSANNATDWTFAKNENINAFLNADHYLNDQWTLNVAYNYNKSDFHTVYGFLDSYNEIGAYKGTYNYLFGQWRPEAELHNLDVSLNGKFELLGREAEIVAGFSGYRNKVTMPYYASSQSGISSYTDCGNTLRWTNCTLDEFNNGNMPRPYLRSASSQALYNAYYTYDAKLADVLTREKQYGLSLSGRYNLTDRLMVIAGGRYNKWESDQDVFRRGVRDDLYSLKLDQSGFSWFGGLVYDLTDQWSAYISYARTLDPQSEAGAIVGYDGNPIEERQNDTFELGLKGSLFGDRLNTQIAYFHTKQDNLPYYTTYYGCAWHGVSGCSYADTMLEPVFAGPGLKVQGVELSASGSVTPRLQVNAAYTFMDTTWPDLTAWGKNGDGQYASMEMYRWRYAALPKHQFKLFANWQAAERLNLGVGVNFKGKVKRFWSQYQKGLIEKNYPDLSMSKWDLGSSTTIDLMAQYRITNALSARLNVQNLFDKTYYVTPRRDMYGVPRNVMFTLNYQF
ncbi:MULTISPECIES: TonB-dependent siderophore receptor [Brenneria]|uniref:TonB-dependent siderophore receptor n=1 Tax=Brenneria nigrifluens DSM 30175 = ATCC 13028 TaxID=1121120 RepID=A0A2U1UQV9_9GAMM|nr:MULTISPECIES: TonB-dependent siderophore receptor [Brenneria]EHD22205.1 TonB-dependent receptor [Brenneria sp. EniD312]PWC24037.1 TonB-dependent siderophore receptor [Brenneria nigrifluens DSM 30175 = ATCC 13028]QCR05230.1 TonB-dependent siderophore receptor [Brenneria nigrifluens DSM 30175 = ATCC 13028]